MANENQGWTGGEDINWDDIPDDAPKTPDEGLYSATVVEARAEKTSGGHPGVKLTVEIKSPFGGGELGYVHRKVRDTLAVTKDAAFKVKQAAKAARVSPPKGTHFEALEAFASDLVGQDLIIKTQNRPNQDKSRVFANVALYCTPEMADEIAKGGGSAAADASRPAPRKRRTA